MAYCKNCGKIKGLHKKGTLACPDADGYSESLVFNAKEKKRQFIKELKGGSFRDSTEEEIELGLAVEKQRLAIYNQISDLKKVLDLIGKDCTHPIVYDDAPNSPCCGGYVSRTCLICGHISYL